MVLLKEIYHFILHLRLHYQFLLLSGGYLLGGLLADEMNNAAYFLQFLNVHILLFGGATAFNSFWDKDEGPIGGLKNPPKMRSWMHSVSLGFMFIGWAWSFFYGWGYFIIYGVSFMLFWLYSTPHARWKGDPVLSMITIAISTGFNSVLLGHIAAGGSIHFTLLLAASGASFVLLSLYPVSQIFQGEDDTERGDRTFFLEFGLKGVKHFFMISYLTGLIILSISLMVYYVIPGFILLFAGFTTFVLINRIVIKLKGNKEEYNIVMNVKFLASFSFVFFLVVANMIHHRWLGDTFLTKFF